MRTDGLASLGQVIVLLGRAHGPGTEDGAASA